MSSPMTMDGSTTPCWATPKHVFCYTDVSKLNPLTMSNIKQLEALRVIKIVTNLLIFISKICKHLIGAPSL